MSLTSPAISADNDTLFDWGTCGHPASWTKQDLSAAAAGPDLGSVPRGNLFSEKSCPDTDTRIFLRLSGWLRKAKCNNNFLLYVCLAGYCFDRTGDNSFKPKKVRFRLNIRKIFFVMRMMEYWHKLPKGVRGAPSLEALKAKLDGLVEDFSARGSKVGLDSL